MSELKTLLSYPIQNNDLTSGALDDSEIIGGMKIVQKRTDLDVLKVIETVELEGTDTQDWKLRKHILKNGSLAYVADEGLMYRWNTKLKVTDENGIEHATDGEWVLADELPDVDENGVLIGVKTIDINGVNRETLDYELEALRDEIEKTDASGDVSRNEFNALDNRVDTLETKVNNINTSGGGSSGGTVDINLEDGTGTGAIQQKLDTNPVNFTDRNPNASAIDTSLKGNINTGARGNNSASFNGNTMAMGSRAMAINNKTIAKGDESFAQGYQSVALGGSCFAGGVKTVAGTTKIRDGKQIGEGAVALGCQTQAIEDYATALGAETIASGKQSFAEGYQSKAKGEASHAGGNNTEAIGIAAFAHGAEAKALSTYTFAVGARTEASGIAAFAQGVDTVASGAASHTQGTSTEASGDHSHAGGVNSSAGAYAAFANGDHVRAGFAWQAVFGRYNKNIEGNLLEIGNGEVGKPSNAFEVLADGRAKVYSEPKDDNDVVRYYELKKYGGGGSVTPTLNEDGVLCF